MSCGSCGGDTVLGRDGMGRGEGKAEKDYTREDLGKERGRDEV